MKTDRLITIGTYWLEPWNCRLVGRDTQEPYNGATGRYPKGSDACAEIVVPLNTKAWWETVSALLHEAVELVAYQMGFEYEEPLSMYPANGKRLLVMDHAGFDEVTKRAGHFMAEALPDLARVYNGEMKRASKTKGAQKK